MSSEYIPLEVEAEILKRLPVQSLLRFRSVSKPWKRVIDSPDFVVSYGVRHPRPSGFIVSHEDAFIVNEYRHYRFFVDDGPSFVPDYFVPPVPYNDLLLLRDGHPCLVGSSHGLLCFKTIYHERMYDDYHKRRYDDSSSELSLEMVVLWNPSIRKSVRIPVPFMYDSPNTSYNVVNAFGFGVCPVTNDPTILKIKWMDKPGISPWRVRVFTLSTGTWNILSTNLPRDSIQLRGSQVVIDRFIYWLAFDRIERRDGRDLLHFLIMSFDLTAKEFKEINLTGSLTHWRCGIESISKLRESLVLLGYHREFKRHPSVCCLWMMTKEQGGNSSFTKLYNINVPHAKVKTVLGFRKTGELILVTKQESFRGSKLEIYDPNSEANVNLDMHGEDYSFFMCSYTESLFLLDQFSDFTGFCVVDVNEVLE
uniref:putative F-box protein At3g10240 n=1 Tax=Erigeron canadensis TaxID=72917 RepID=UPI001CB9AB78|nr:putative F-box protein At3g10240 [Erigeron canadensis]